MLLPGVEDRNIVVFKLLPSMAYNTRLLAAFLLVLLGLAVQGITLSLWLGLIPLLLANALLLVSGYDNRVDFGRFDPRAEWERVDQAKLDELIQLDRKMRKWDLSSFDITNVLGAVIFVLVALLLGLGVFFGRGMIRILFVDALVLLLPHWFTGIRRILTRPGMTIKVDTIREILKHASERLKAHQLQVMMLLAGSDTRMPRDVKFKVEIKDHPPRFLGLYGQVVLNEVQGKSFPYFYVVLVARKDSGLRSLYDSFVTPAEITSEFKYQDDVEVLVVRQKTTKTSGYHTKVPAALGIFREGLILAEKLARSQS
jgi:hypothetical protein